MKKVKTVSHHKLFNVDSHYAKDFVVLNWHGSPIEEFGVYADAYHHAAMMLVREYRNTGAVRDIEAAPILFLYRHSFELYLKAFMLIGSNILQLTKKPSMPIEKILNTHKLTDFIPFFEAIIKTVGWSWNMGEKGLETKDDFVSLVKEFDSVDPGSYSFRYPTDKHGKGTVSSHFAFNLSSFAQRIDPLLEVLDAAITGLEDYWDNAAQTAYEAQE